MEAILNCKPKDLEDYYALLGCDELSSRLVLSNIRDLLMLQQKICQRNKSCVISVWTEQILNEYKIRALACHPDKHLDNPRAVADFQKLQEAKEVLCDETKRKNYDLWTRSGVTISFNDWKALNDSVKTSMHWAVRNKKEPMLEASIAEIPVTSQAEELSSDGEAERILPYDATASPNDYCHRRFRWAADSPSNLLQKFRNYEI